MHAVLLVMRAAIPYLVMVILFGLAFWLDCLRREIREELPELKLGRLKLWKEVKARNPRSGRKMSDAIFIANKASGHLAIGDKQEIYKATWRKPRGWTDVADLRSRP
jgi:hypothetical protein